jgi:hypothetical protein
MNAQTDTIGFTPPTRIDGRKLVPNRANTKTPGIRLPSHYIASAARRRGETDAKAMRWMLNYAAIVGSELEEFAERFHMTLPDLRDALTNPYAEREHILALTYGVKALRLEFEQRLNATDIPTANELASPFRPGSALCEGYNPIAATHVAKTVKSALNATLKRGAITEIIGLTRIGKTTPAVHWFLRNLDEAVYFVCPETHGDMDFLLAFGRAVCAPLPTNCNAARARDRIEQAFDRGGYRMVIVDEGHNLWRSRHKTPSRLEFLRRLRDQHGVCVAILATPQFTEHLATALAGDSKWAPGQYDGRAEPYHLPETLKDADIDAVMRLHAPEFDDALITELVSFAKRSHGYLGAAVNVISRARDAFEEHPAADRAKLFAEVMKRQENGRRAELKAAGKLVAQLRIGGGK